MNASIPSRRWYQFSLRTMFVVVALVSIPLAWVGYSLNWIRKREEAMLTFAPLAPYMPDLEKWPPQLPVDAPAGLWLFGEEAVLAVHCLPEHVAAVRRLFPEAQIQIDREGTN